jgi:hypothetical protein
MIHPLKTTKDLLKEEALLIRTIKRSLKQKNRLSDPTLEKYYQQAWKLNTLKFNYRHFHIAYCEVRGRTREKIETPHPNHAAKETFIQTYKNKLISELVKYHETVCSS